MEITAFQQLMEDLYGEADRARGIPSTVAWLCEEVGELAQAITLQEAGRLTRVPGIGKKTAERLLLEMRGKLGADIGHQPLPNANHHVPLNKCGNAREQIDDQYNHNGPPQARPITRNHIVVYGPPHQDWPS